MSARKRVLEAPAVGPPLASESDLRRDAPSKFWQRLAAEHERDLQTFGFEMVKRRQALRYFNWTWRLGRAVRSEQLRFLWDNTSTFTKVKAAVVGADLSDAAWVGCDWPRRDRRFYTFAVRLLWAYAQSDDERGVLRLPEPALGGPLPVEWNGRLISQDLANSALEVSAIHRSLEGGTPRSIIEVGAGYGRSAYALLSTYPDARYTVVDIEPALSISRWYLSRLFPPERLAFLTPSEADSLPAASFDLAVSISSLQEMTPAQVARYIRLFDRVASGGTVFLKQWREWRNPEDGVVMRFTDYPLPASWQLRRRERPAVQTTFVQAAWRLARDRMA